MNMNELIEDIIALKGVKTKCLNNNLQMTCWLDKKTEHLLWILMV